MTVGLTMTPIAKNDFQSLTIPREIKDSLHVGDYLQPSVREHINEFPNFNRILSTCAFSRVIHLLIRNMM